MTAPADRYTDRKTHPCGCTTVWDTHTDTSRYFDACRTHTMHALPNSVAAQQPQPKWVKRP